MTSLEVSGPHGDALPSINNLDFDKYRLDKVDHSRHSTTNFNPITRPIMNSPLTSYSGPPPPYSSAIPATNSTPNLSAYLPPSESSSRRSTRDGKESPKGSTSLPSISEALKNADMPPSTQQYPSTTVSVASILQTLGEAPKGPGNPFSQPTAPASALRSSFSSATENSPGNNVPPPPPGPLDTRQSGLVHSLSSPHGNPTSHGLSGPLPSTAQTDSQFRSSFSLESPRPGYPFPDHHGPRASITPQSSGTFSFEPRSKVAESRNPYTKSDPLPYNETVKRHLDVYDAELALNEITEASSRTLDFSKVWSQRYHQSNRSSYFSESLPTATEIDTMIQYSHHILENLSRLREVAIIQQNALSEQRAHAARGQHPDDEFHHMPDDYKSGGFAGGDAKKRRGKAAPPGRCHSCSRAETPEWRRGPDGARTLCNACGLHYAKLTRKMGANKAAIMTGSNLRPKNANDIRP